MNQLNQQWAIPLYLLIIVTLTIKGIALWVAARNGQKNWFIFFVASLIVNLFGIPEIIYLIFFSKPKFDFQTLMFWTNRKQSEKTKHGEK